MSETVLSPAAIERAKEQFMNPNNYGAFDLTEDNQWAIGCIDPRAEETEKKMLITVQTPGGAIGVAYDESLTAYAYGGTVLPIKEAVVNARNRQVVMVTGAHPSCAFRLGMDKILAETINPQDLTTSTVGRLVTRYGLENMDKNFRRIKDSASAMADRLAANPDEIDESELIGTVDRLHPTHRNVPKPEGDNKAAFYIFNHHRILGLDRQQIHRIRSLEVQAYHDSIAATINNVWSMTGQNGEQRGLRVASVLYRTAVTRTVLSQKGNVQGLHVIEDHENRKGFRIVEEIL